MIERAWAVRAFSEVDSSIMPQHVICCPFCQIKVLEKNVEALEDAG